MLLIYFFVSRVAVWRSSKEFVDDVMSDDGSLGGGLEPLG